MDKTPVKDVMSDVPHVTEPKTTLRSAAKIMEEYECGSLPICENGELVGIITDRDIVIFGLASDKDVDECTVEEIMTTRVFTCYEDDTLEVAADTMGDLEVRRLVVLGEDNKITGIISVSDMIKCADNDSINDDILHHLFKYA